MRIALAIAAGVLLLCCGCSTAEPAAVAPVGVSAATNCTETEPTPAGLRPPVLTSTTLRWFGTSDLWVGLPDHAGTPQGDRIVLKVPWVTLQADQPTSALGAPQVSATRAGLMTPVAASLGAYSQAYGTGGLAFWPATIEFPGAGCWTVTGRFGPTTVEFVIKVDAG
jgi:hypothetical protein